MFRTIFHTVLVAGSVVLFLCVGARADVIQISESATVTTENLYTGNNSIEVISNAQVQFNAKQNYTGSTTITSGRLVLNVTEGFKNSNAWLIKDGGELDLGIKSPLGTNMTATITIEQGGILDYTANDGNFSNIAKLVLNGGTVQCSSTNYNKGWGAYLFRDDVECNADSEISAPFLIRAGFGNCSGKPTWTVAEGATLTVSGQVRFQDTGATPDYPIITKKGDGTLLFTKSSTGVHKDSQFIVEAGTLRFTNANAFQDGTNAMKISVTGGKTTIEGVETPTVGKLDFEGSGTIKNNISISAGQSVEFKPKGGTVTYTGALTGSGSFKNTSTDWQKLTLKGDNSAFTGTVGSAGLLFFDGVGSALPKGTLNGGGTICFLPADAEHSVFQFGALTGSGTLRPSESSACDFTLQVGAKNTNSTFTGELTDFDSNPEKLIDYQRAITLEKVGTGKLTLTNKNNKYRGGTIVTAGTLAYTVQGALGRGTITVGSDAEKAPEAKLLFEPTTAADATITDDVLINKSGILAITNWSSGKQIVYSGSPTGTGTLRLDTQKGYIRLTGDNSAFAGKVETTTTSGNHLFFKNGQSASKSAAYKISSPVVFWSTEANQVYEFGALTMTGWEWRFSGESMTNPSATMRIGNLNQNDTLQTLLQANIKLEKVGTGTLTIKQSGTNNNNYSGGTVVKAGTLDATYPKALGSGAVSVEGGTLKYSGATTDYSNNTTIGENGTFELNAKDKTLTVKGTLTGSGKIDVQAGTFKYTGSTTAFDHDINIAANATCELANAPTLTGDLTGSGKFIISGGRATIKGNNTQFSGTVQRDSEAFYYNGESTSGLADYTGGGSMFFVCENASSTNVYELGSLSGSGTLRQSERSYNGGITLKVGGNNKDTTFDGILASYKDKRTLALVKTGTGTLTLTKDLSVPNLGGGDTTVVPYSGGTTVENGRLIIAKGAVIGSGDDDLVFVEAVSKDATPAITLSGTIRGDLKIDGLLAIDFTSEQNPVGNVTGDITFGDAAALEFIVDESTLNQGMTYTLNSANPTDLSVSLTKLYNDAISAGTLPDILSITQTASGVMMGIDASKIPEPATWLLLLVGAMTLASINHSKKTIMNNE